MVSVGLAVAPVGNTAEPRMKRLAVIVAAKVAVDHRAFGIVAHARRAHDVAGAFRRVAVLDLRGAEPAEDLGVRRARGGKACLGHSRRGDRQGAAAARRRCPFRRDRASRGSPGRAAAPPARRGGRGARPGRAARRSSACPRKPLPRELGGGGDRRARRPRPAVIADLDAHGGAVLAEGAVAESSRCSRSRAVRDRAIPARAQAPSSAASDGP